MEGLYTHKFYVFVNVLEGRGGWTEGSEETAYVTIKFTFNIPIIPSHGQPLGSRLSMVPPIIGDDCSPSIPFPFLLKIVGPLPPPKKCPDPSLPEDKNDWFLGLKSMITH